MSTLKAKKKTTKAVVESAAKGATKKIVKAPAKKLARPTMPKTASAASTDLLARVRGGQQAVSIGKAGGRPMLSWVGKRAPASVQAFPAQLVEAYGEQASKGALWERWPEDLRRGGLLYHGDNKEVLAHLLANGFRGQVKLIYIDPPFDSGADYVRKVELRGPKGKAKLYGESYTLGEQIQYTDIWANDNYLQFMYERLLLLKELLSEDGALYLHCDWNKAHHLRCLLEEVFGQKGFRNEIIWQRVAARSDSTTFNHVHDVIMYCTKGSSFVWNQQYHAHSEAYLDTKYARADAFGRQYRLDNITSPNPRPNMVYDWKGHSPPENGWRYSKETMQRLHDEGRIWYPADKGKRPQLIRYLDEVEGVPLRSVWTDIHPVNSQADERSEYPTQKPESLLERLVATSSVPGDIVLDCFIGSGTTAAVAQKLGRRWIGCDINKGAIQTTAKRLQLVIADQASESECDQPAQGKLLGESEASPPAQLGFTHWRVNDYDLAIQHNEAVNLACEYLGVERLRNDTFFDGLLGKRLVKIISFGHPLSPMDLESIRNELEARPDEDRAITVVCLGKELSSDTWLAEWNRLRKKKNDPHHIEVIELRSDPKYGGFIQHEQAQARVVVKRKGGKLHVEIKDFVSPGILQRLAQQSGVVQAKVADWRAMVDSVMIDTAYDGAVFNVVHADVPLRKTDFVTGEYTFDVPKSETTVAVKITDMLGEEVLVTHAT